MGDAVADTGPLIHLEEVGALTALRVFDVVLVAPQVARELAAGQGRPGSRAVELPNVRLHHGGPPRPPGARASSLSAADRAALHLAATHGAVLVTDDLDLRDAAAAVGVGVVGSIGVLLRAARDGHLSVDAVDGHLDAIFDRSSLFVTRPLVDRAKDALRRWAEEQA